MNVIFDYRIWLIVICAISVILLNRRVKDFIYSYHLKVVSSIDYDEAKILTHLQYIIQQCLDYYHLFYIVAAPKEIYNINAKIQQEIIAYLTNEVPNRISPLLHNQLAMIYNESNLGKVIGEYIYMVVQDFSISFNNEMANSASQKKLQLIFTASVNFD